MMKKAAFIAVLSVFLISGHDSAVALSALQWVSTVVASSTNLSTCLGVGENALKSLNFRDIDRRSDHVDARHGGALVVYTCVDAKPHSTAIVMMMSDDGKEAERLRVAVQDEIKKAKGF